MAMAVGHGLKMMLQADVASPQCRVDVALSSGGDGVVWGRAGRMTTIVTIGRKSTRFGYLAAEAETASSSYPISCRMQRMTITRSSRGSGKQEALRSGKQSDVGAGGAEADGMIGEEEAIGSFWERLQLAWRVLIGAPNEAQATKRRFSRLLVRDRGFNSTNLSRLYNAAKGAIQEHVELEGEEDTEVTAVVDRLGELRLDFRVKRVRSVLRDEPFSDSVLPEMEPRLSISGDQVWEDSRLLHDSNFQGGAAAEDCPLNYASQDVESSLSMSGDQLWEHNGAPFDLKARLETALHRPIPNSGVSDGEPLLSVSGGLLWKASRTPMDVVGGALDDLFPMTVVDHEPHLAVSRDQSWDDRTASQGLEDQVGHPNLTKCVVTGASSEPFPNSILPNRKPSISPVGRDELLKEGKALDLISTVDVDVEGEWYTFSFTDSTRGQKAMTTKADGNLDQLH